MVYFRPAGKKGSSLVLHK